MAAISEPITSAPLSELGESSMSNLWIYILGEKGGEDIKIGHTKDPTIRRRLNSVNGDQTTLANYILLAGVRGSAKDERAIQDYFSEYQRDDKGRRKEYFHPEAPLVEYAAWLRSRWWVTVDLDGDLLEYPAEDPSHWHPAPDRRHRKPINDPTKMVQDYEVAPGALPGPWSWFPNPTQSFQDYFTPTEVIDAARCAMGGIDLDAASHWAANREHQIPDYFDAGRCAFKHAWHGRVWLNPPYGNNGPWFDRALEFIGSGDVSQICMLSPMWAFTTSIAAEFMAASSAMCILSPTPKFWGNAGGKTGTNQPHGVVYIGDREVEFRKAFSYAQNILCRTDAFVETRGVAA